MRRCAAGRELYSDTLPEWKDPCPEEGTDLMLLGQPDGTEIELDLCIGHIFILQPDKVIWETCAGCGREYAYPHLCRTHMLCGLCNHDHRTGELTDRSPVG